MGGAFATDVTQIALTLAGIALVALLVSHAQGTTDIIKSAASSYGGLLSIVTLQSQYGNSFA
jgi:hypothetical protein